MKKSTFFSAFFLERSKKAYEKKKKQPLFSEIPETMQKKFPGPASNFFVGSYVFFSKKCLFFVENYRVKLLLVNYRIVNHRPVWGIVGLTFMQSYRFLELEKTFLVIFSNLLTHRGIFLTFITDKLKTEFLFLKYSIKLFSSFLFTLRGILKLI